MNKFHNLGFVPGPRETKLSYNNRVKLVINFSKNLLKEDRYFVNKRILKLSQEITKSIFDFYSECIVAYYDFNGMSFFESACTHLENIGDLTLPIVQLKNADKPRGFFQRKISHLYSAKEILAHEAVHAARAELNSIKFEEIFAYMTSENRFRKFLGPMFQSNKDSYVFLFSTFLLSITWMVLSFLDVECKFLLSLFFIFPLFLCGRLLFFKYILRRCIKNIKPLLKHNVDPVHVVFRFTDEEIFKFSKNKNDASSFVVNDNSFRWEILKDYYFEPKLRPLNN